MLNKKESPELSFFVFMIFNIQSSVADAAGSPEISRWRLLFDRALSRIFFGQILWQIYLTKFAPQCVYARI